MATAEFPGAGRISWCRAMRPPACPANAVGMAAYRSERHRRIADFGASNKRGADITRGRANHTGTAMGAGRPDAGPDPGVGLQPATSGTHEYQRGRRERPWPAAGGNPQHAVGLVLPAAAERRQSGMGANGDVVMVTTEPPPGMSWRRFARCRYSRRPAA